MRNLNDELRSSISAANQRAASLEAHEKELKAAADSMKDEDTRSLIHGFPFGVRRPMGGDGDEDEEEDIIEDVDDAGGDVVEGNDDEEGQQTPSARLQNASDTLIKTSRVLRRLTLSTPSRISLHRHGSQDGVVPSPTATLASPVPPSPATTTRSRTASNASRMSSRPSTSGGVPLVRTSSLTFAEPNLPPRTSKVAASPTLPDTREEPHSSH